MSVCISDICNLLIFKNKIQLIAGENGLSKVVNHVTVMEVPDFADKNLVNGIFILTTFYSYRNDINLMVEAMDKLAKKEISGIAIKINRFITETPLKIIEIANKNNIPLFVINDKSLSFSEIISAITSEIINYQFSILKEINEQQHLLNNAILNGENISNFLKIISNQIQLNSICTSYEGKILAEYCVTGEQSKDGIQSLIQEINTIGINIKDMLSSPPYIFMRDYYVFPCIGHNQVLGYFSLQKQFSISERELFLAQQMVSFLSIKLLEKYLLLENEQRMTNVIINELLFREYSDESVVKERLHFLGFVPNTYYRIIMFSLNRENYNKDFYKLKIKLESLSSYLKGIFPNSIITLIADGFIALVPFPRISKFIRNESLRISLENMEEKLNFLSDMSIGFSPVQSDLRLIPNYFKSVKQAIKFGRAFNTDGHIYCYDDFPTVKLVSHMLNTEEYTLIKNTIILPLKEYDEKYKSELKLTLEKCLTNNTLERAAAELYIHSSTLRYRLQKIKDLTNADYFSTQGKYLLNTAYIISKLNP